MTKPGSSRAPKGAAGGICRPSRRRGEAPRGKEWVRPYKRAQRALDNAASLILAAIHAVVDAGLCASRPCRSTRILTAALRRATKAQEQLNAAKGYLAEAIQALALTPPELWSGDAPVLLELVHERYEKAQHYIYVAAREALLGHQEIARAVEAGEVVPEDASEDQPRPRRVIVVVPRPLFVRAFLAARRQPRVGDRITPLLRRRRRIPCPAEVRVPRRNLRGRAPPLSSTCSL